MVAVETVDVDAEAGGGVEGGVANDDKNIAFLISS